jgi:hypothetical protein
LALSVFEVNHESQGISEENVSELQDRAAQTRRARDLLGSDTQTTPGLEAWQMVDFCGINQ